MHSLKLIRDALKDRIEADYFGDLAARGTPSSVRQFIEYMAAGNVASRRHGEPDRATFPDLTDLHMTFSAFLDAVVLFEGGGAVTLGYFFGEKFCTQLVGPLARTVAHERQYDGEDQNTAFSEVGASSWGEWIAAVSETKLSLAVGTAVYDEFVKAHADKPLISFFIKPTPPGIFSMWGPAASSGVGRKLPKRVISTDDYSVEVTVSRYEEIEGPVVAYEWLATLNKVGNNEPDAAACGMVYVFERVDGRPVGDLDDLVLVADSMTDEDVLQATSFIRQHSDAEELIQKSDLCFVWIWEKRSGAEKGLGAKCLMAGLADLRRRFKKIRTAIFDVRPVQFVDRAPAADPPMVAVERQTAIENLSSYVQNLALDFETRLIFNRSENPFHDALLAIGEAGSAKRRQNEEADDDDDVGIDIDSWRGELIELFEIAGLDCLASDLENGIESRIDVDTALRHLVFDTQVHYLRVPSFKGVDATSPYADNFIPVGQALGTVEGFEAFYEDLPDEMDVLTAFYLGNSFICVVQASTLFGDLVDYFTLVPKPRPMSIQKFFRTLDD